MRQTSKRTSKTSLLWEDRPTKRKYALTGPAAQRIFSVAVFFIMMSVGILLGSMIAFVPELGEQGRATPVRDVVQRELATPYMAEIQPEKRLAFRREAVKAPQLTNTQDLPKIAIVIDDLGMDKRALKRLLALPGPITLSFLPYAPDVQAQVDNTLAAGHDVMLHLPMEPFASEGKKLDPGRNALLTSDNPSQLYAKLEKNLSAFSGYTGVNNHMGSKFTSNLAAMEIVFQQLGKRNLFFVDSITSGRSVAETAARESGIELLRRDVFLDADHGDTAKVQIKKQLAELETLARENGQAIAIGHPYKTTIDALGPWLVTAEARGFQIVMVDDLLVDEEPVTTLSALR